MNKLLTTYTLLAGLLASGGTASQTCTNAHMAESTPASRYTFHAGGTVTDTKTGLMWKRCQEGQTFSDNGTPGNYLDDACTGEVTVMDWRVALNQPKTANNANDSGHNDWRVPNLKELNSIVEYCRVDPALNTEVFPGTTLVVWSSSPVTYPGYEVYAWNVSLSNGYNSMSTRNASGYVRLVRSGQ